jgi:HEAT repeat protein
MLGKKASPAETALRQRLADPSSAVQIAAAEALGRQGQAELALPVLERWLQTTNPPAAALQAANVLDRFGETARPVLPAMRRVLANSPSAQNETGRTGEYPVRILERITAVLEGKVPPLVYPAPKD